MKIQRIDTLRPKARPSLIWVRLHTEDGLIGLGESWFGCDAIEADIHGRLALLLLGEDARRIEALHRKMQPYVGFTGTSAETRALSAVDVALWDLAGQRAGLPLHDLLGGKSRDRVPLYNTCAGPDYVSQSADVRPGNFGLGSGAAAASVQARPRYEDLQGFLERPAELASELLDMGISAMKIWPFDFAEGAHDGMTISPQDLNRALWPFEEIRRVHGDRMRLKAELHGLWSVNAAGRICRALAPIDPDWVEDPLWMDRFDPLSELADIGIPLAGGETLGGLGQIRDLLQRGRIHTPIIDVTWGGGITFARKAAALAEAEARPIAFHDCSGPITLAVSTHLAMALPNVAEQEFTRAFYYGWYGDCIDGLPPIENGMIRVSGEPGLGVRLKVDTEGVDNAVNCTTSQG
ncbi:mandelate racemase/muconate lactonizing enzyme family protein [Halomonas litopenaei]|uniref:mandelate racemase/muconate lactonizing enzyme family protein n=1 Tax=Halomonas litopenaei TaxID=2109328 RepID=UPI001A8E8E8B|nr:mandelate racemase/muconate lactonizing enzyme family protein [Halomonas litopenaei]MBN8412412.1 mandelate racemase/muconate lactonizing enzyme family protein [Halomonas litopenaei]